jgi:hypothetical protein
LILLPVNWKVRREGWQTDIFRRIQGNEDFAVWFNIGGEGLEMGLFCLDMATWLLVPACAGALKRMLKLHMMSNFHCTAAAIVDTPVAELYSLGARYDTQGKYKQACDHLIGASFHYRYPKLVKDTLWVFPPGLSRINSEQDDMNL